jgi:hypothetical protein
VKRRAAGGCGTGPDVCCIFNIHKGSTVFTRLIDLLKRSPRPGDGKDPAMPTDPNVSPPAPASPPVPASFDQQLLALADAVRELSRSHQTLLDAVARPAAATVPAAAPETGAPAAVSGDPGDGLRPSAAVDYARLSPVQQIALGLRGAMPQGPRVLPGRASARHPQPAEEPDLAPAGAD